MRRYRLGAVGAALAILSSVALAPLASADESRSVQLVSQQGRELSFVVYLDPSIEPNGEPVTSKVVIGSTEVPSQVSASVQGTKSSEAILVLDTSGSMRGDRIAAAQVAAKSYVNSLPASVDVGLIAFNNDAEIALAPTNDRDAVLAEIDSVKARQRTALYDAIIGGSDLANPAKNPRLVVLSDGGDSASAATFDDVRARIAADGIPIDVVALTPSVSHAEVLREIADTSGGQFLLATDAAGLDRAFGEAAGSFGSKISVTATVPAEVDASAKFAVVTVDVNGTEYTGTAKLPRTDELSGTGAGAAGVVPPTDTLIPPTVPVAQSSAGPAVLYGLLAGLIVVVLVLAVAYYRQQRRSLLRTEQVLWYSSAGLVDGDRVPRPGISQFALMRELDTWLSSRRNYPVIDAKLDNAAVALSPAAWLVIRIGVGVGMVLVCWILFGNFLVGLIVGVLLAWLLTKWFLGRREAKNRKAFETELPDFLLLIASSLRTGLSFAQGLDSAAADGQGQVSRQMRRALRESQMGAPIEQSLMRVSERMDNEDLKWVVVALTIQREVGGNLSNVLETAARTVQSRAELRREIRTLSAEGKLSGWILAAMPVGLFLYMLVANREYVSFFWTQPIGFICLGVISVAFIAGVLWMSKLVKIEV
jgi:tight adherence protein B